MRDSFPGADQAPAELVKRESVITEQLVWHAVVVDGLFHSSKGIAGVFPVRKDAGADIETGRVVDELIDRYRGLVGVMEFVDERVDLPELHGLAALEPHHGSFGAFFRVGLHRSCSAKHTSDRGY